MPRKKRRKILRFLRSLEFKNFRIYIVKFFRIKEVVNQWVDIPTVSKRLGHARISTTNDIYAHSLKKADAEAANKLENLFNKKKQSKVRYKK